VTCSILTTALSKTLNKKITTSISHLSRTIINASLTGHREVMDQVWIIFKIIKTNAMILLVGKLQYIAEKVVPSGLGSLMKLESVKKMEPLSQMNIDGLGIIIMNQNITVVLVEKEDQRLGQKSQKSGISAIMVTWILKMIMLSSSVILETTTRNVTVTKIYIVIKIVVLVLNWHQSIIPLDII
jgi:hypothetical protein